MKTRISRSLLFAYTSLPYLFFGFIFGCWLFSEIAWGGTNWQNPYAPYPTGYEVFNPWADIFLFPAVLGMLFFPLVFIIRLIFYRRHNWRELLPAALGYLLLFCLIILSGKMGWWID
jgi:hypothetical protein